LACRFRSRRRTRDGSSDDARIPRSGIAAGCDRRWGPILRGVARSPDSALGQSPGRRVGAVLCAALGLIGAAAADPLAFTSMSGAPVTLALEEEERALIVHFWATWCPTCIAELGELDAAARRCRSRPVRVVTVNVGEDSDQISDYTAKIGLRLPVLRDPKGEVWRELSGVGLPINLIWTRDARSVEVGPRDTDQWIETFRTLGCDAGEAPSGDPG